ncbi:hypothetical protein GMRT_13198 [Giardia muris]|uniref:Uncharacterized protein n=1 Tax=Giardia muris TaxID=5742 RepID=A0A4Z1SRY1_GIAMU|nr:hypothetical protein GMRT_13198 [Giardia muris]|eukprot:TNJ28672.1 hypothetical protein GMRT_13198 [Giardia muris]
MSASAPSLSSSVTIDELRLEALAAILLIGLLLSILHLTARKRYTRKLVGVSRYYATVRTTEAVIKRVSKSVYVAYAGRPMIIFLSPVSRTLLVIGPLPLDESQLRFLEDLTQVGDYQAAVSAIVSTSGSDATEAFMLRYPGARVFRTVTAFENFTRENQSFDQVILQRPYPHADRCRDAFVFINDLPIGYEQTKSTEKVVVGEVVCCLPHHFKANNKISCGRFTRAALARTLLAMTTAGTKTLRASKAVPENSLGMIPTTIVTYQGELFIGQEMCEALLLAGAETLKPGTTTDMQG